MVHELQEKYVRLFTVTHALNVNTFPEASKSAMRETYNKITHLARLYAGFCPCRNEQNRGVILLVRARTKFLCTDEQNFRGEFCAYPERKASKHIRSRARFR